MLDALRHLCVIYVSGGLCFKHMANFQSINIQSWQISKQHASFQSKSMPKVILIWCLELIFFLFRFLSAYYANEVTNYWLNLLSLNLRRNSSTFIKHIHRQNWAIIERRRKKPPKIRCRWLFIYWNKILKESMCLWYIFHFFDAWISKIIGLSNV